MADTVVGGKQTLDARPTLFIVSSSKAAKLARAFQDVLKETGKVLAQSWEGPGAFPNNVQILRSLLKHACEKDFALVILTGDDVVKLRGKEVYVPRDNCIFEFGLFIGAFRKPERCFLLSAVEPEVLLEQLIDIGGQVYKMLKLPDGRRDREEHLKSVGACLMTAKENCKPILGMIEAQGRFFDHPRGPRLTTEELMVQEADRYRIRKRSLILIKERELPESSLRYAKVVRENMDRPVNYLYLFERQQEHYPIIADMLRSLALVGVVPEDQFSDYENLKEEERKSWLKRDKERVRKNIEKLMRRMLIRFTDAVKFDEFCIHMADKDEPRGFLKIGHKYVEMQSAMAKERYNYPRYGARKKWPSRVIFDPGSLDPDQVEDIRYQIEDKFPRNLQETMGKACFGDDEGRLRSQRCPECRGTGRHQVDDGGSREAAG